MIKKTLILGIVLTLAFCGFVSASEVTGDLSNQIETGITGTLKSAPVFSLDSGTYNSTQSVTLTASDSTAICYSTSEDNPSCSNYNTCSVGTKYASAISITTTTSIKAVACYADNTQGPVSATKTYTLACATSSVTNGTVGAYPSCAISCNSGYSLSGSSCAIVSSGSTGGTTTSSPGSTSSSSTYVPPAAVTVAPATTTNTTTTVSPVTTTNTLTNLGLSLPYTNPTNQAENSANRTYLINYLVNLIASLNSQLIIQQPVQNNPSVGPFNRTLTLGMNNDDVKDLQEFLVSQGEAIYPEKQVTGYFGNLTLLAIGRFQIAQGIVSGPSDGGYGIVGPLTRSRINSILGY